MDILLHTFYRFFERNLEAFHYLPLIFLHNRSGNVKERDFIDFLGEAYVNSNLLDFLIDKELMKKENNKYSITKKGLINVFVNRLTDKPIVPIDSNISNNSSLLILKIIESLIRNVPLTIPYNKSFALFSSLGIIKGIYNVVDSSIEVSYYNFEEIFFYSNIKRFKYYFDMLDKINLLVQHRNLSGQGFPFKKIIRFKHEIKTRIDLLSHPKYENYNYLSYTPLKIREIVNKLSLSGIFTYNSNEDSYKITDQGIDINLKLIENSNKEFAQNINSNNSLIISGVMA